MFVCSSRFYMRSFRHFLFGAFPLPFFLFVDSSWEAYFTHTLCVISKLLIYICKYVYLQFNFHSLLVQHVQTLHTHSHTDQLDWSAHLPHTFCKYPIYAIPFTIGDRPTESKRDESLALTNLDGGQRARAVYARKRHRMRMHTAAAMCLQASRLLLFGRFGGNLHFKLPLDRHMYSAIYALFIIVRNWNCEIFGLRSGESRAPKTETYAKVVRGRQVDTRQQQASFHHIGSAKPVQRGGGGGGTGSNRSIEKMYMCI